VKSVIVGTAGHIDHGKSALVRALTGTDPDRLEEEKRRGITIDIGFAHLELTGERGESVRIGFVDVPGHERFVRNMLAGVGGIDLALLVVAADEGIKPQTREHFDICRLLDIPRGLVVITKTDTVDRETVDVVRLELEEFVRGSFLADAPVLAVSSKTGEGLDELKRELARAAAEVRARDTGAAPRLPIDRVFTMKGFGTVVTGTLVSGSIRKEQELEVFPGGRRVRVRGVQVHGQPAEQAVAGERTALNLAGATTEELARGMTLAEPAVFRAAARVDVALSLLPSARPLRDRSRVHLHAYTMETIAQIVLVSRGPETRVPQLKPGETAYAQLRLREPALLLPGDRFIIRQFSPVVTIGGGVVLDAAPLARRTPPEQRVAFLERVAWVSDPGVLAARVARRATRGLSLADAVAETGWWPPRRVEEAARALPPATLSRLGDVFVSQSAFGKAEQEALAAVEAFHRANPLVPGIRKGELAEKLALGENVLEAVLAALVREQRLEVSAEQVRMAGRGVAMKDEEAESKRIIEQAFAGAGLKVPALKDVLAGLKVDRARAQKIVTLLLRDRVLVKLSDDLVFHREALDALRRTMAAEKAKSPKMDVARFKDVTGVSRKYAIPLLEWLDRERVTRRVGDVREIL
jgi:selenocysteine-specific elongation factor